MNHRTKGISTPQQSPLPIERIFTLTSPLAHVEHSPCVIEMANACYSVTSPLDDPPKRLDGIDQQLRALQEAIHDMDSEMRRLTGEVRYRPPSAGSGVSRGAGSMGDRLCSHACVRAVIPFFLVAAVSSASK